MNQMGRYFFVISLGVLLGVSGSMVLGGKTFVLNAVETAIGKDSNKTGGEESGELMVGGGMCVTRHCAR